MNGDFEPRDSALIVEAGEAYLHEDYQALERYAWAGIPTAWIMNLNDPRIEVYASPTGPFVREISRNDDLSNRR